MMSKLLNNEKPLLILPELAAKLGLNETIFLQQLHYWLQDSKNVRDGHKWVYNTYDEWHKQFPFWSLSTLRRVIAKLEKENLIITGNYNRFKLDKTKWYRINYDSLGPLLDMKDEVDSECVCLQKEIDTDGSHSETEEHVSPSFVHYEKKMNNKGIQNEENTTNPTVQFDKEDVSKQTANENHLNKALPESTSEITPEKSVAATAKLAHAQPENPFQFFEQNGFGAINVYLYEKIKAWCNDLSEELVVEALKEAVVNGSKNWNYVEAILRSWAEKGCQTVDDVHAAQRSFKERLSKKVNLQTPENRREIPRFKGIDYTAGEDG